MLVNAVVRVMGENSDWQVFGTVRGEGAGLMRFMAEKMAAWSQLMLDTPASEAP